MKNKTSNNEVFKNSGYIQYILKHTKSSKHAKSGEAWAQKAMGDIYYYGIGMEEEIDNMGDEEKSAAIEGNFKHSYEYYKKAANQGYAPAMHAVGNAHLHGEGAKQDDKEAVNWYRKAKDKKHAEAIHSLARMYEYGLGVGRDPVKATEYYWEAISERLHADSIYPWAQLCLKDREVTNTSLRFVLELLLVAQQVNTDPAFYNYGTGPEWAIKHYDLWNIVSPWERKYTWERVLRGVEDYDWDSATRNALVSEINKKTAIVTPSSKPELFTDQDVYERVWRSVVVIVGSNGQLGSGVIVQPNIVATNHHVVRGEESIRVIQPKEKSGEREVYYPVNGRPVQAENLDYCLLHVPLLPGAGVPATIRSFNTLEIGETVYALGAPAGETLSFSKGVISQRRNNKSYLEGYADFRAIQSDASIDNGSSGGGLFDGEGNLVGHPTFARDTSEVLNFSMPADTLLSFADDNSDKKQK